MTKLRPFAFVAAGVGVAGLATFAVAGIMSNSTYSNLETTCKGPCPPELAGDVSKGKTQQTIANEAADRESPVRSRVPITMRSARLARAA